MLAERLIGGLQLKTNLRSIFIAPVEDEERIRFAKEILFIQLVGTELHGGYVLKQQCLFLEPMQPVAHFSVYTAQTLYLYQKTVITN